MTRSPRSAARPLAAAAAGLAILLVALPLSARQEVQQGWLRADPVPRSVVREPDLQLAAHAARDAVLPALVHVEPIIDVYRRGQKSKAAVTGSGVIVSPAGHVLTNDHVVAHARRVRVVLSDQREVSARVIGRDTFTDVAVLQLEEQDEPYPFARLGTSEGIQAGQYVMALGSPLGLARSIREGGGQCYSSAVTASQVPRDHDVDVAEPHAR